MGKQSSYPEAALPLSGADGEYATGVQNGITVQLPTAAIAALADGQNVRRPEYFGAIGDGVADDSAALVDFCSWMCGAPGRVGILSQTYRWARQSSPRYTSSYLTEGAITLINPSNTTLIWAGGVLLMDNLNPSTGNGDQSHGVFVCSIAQQSSGLFLLGRPRVEWKTQPNARSQGDAFHFQGYPSDNSLGTASNGLISNITVGQSFAKWAPQVGSIMCGVSDVDWASHESYQTLADGWHVNASRRVSAGRIKGYETGDDVCAFVTYYSSSSVEGSTPGFSPYFQPNLGNFSNYASSVTDVVNDNGATDALRFAGSLKVRVDSVSSEGGVHAFVQDGGLAGGSDAWTYQQSMGCSVGKVAATGGDEGAFLRSFNVSIATDLSTYWKTDTIIENLEVLSPSSWGIEADSIVGFRVGFADLDGGGAAGGGISMNSIQDVVLGQVHLANVTIASSISGFTNSVGFGATRPVTGLKIGAMWTHSAPFQLVDVSGFDIGSYRSDSSPTHGLYTTNCSDGLIGGVRVYNCNTSAAGSIRALIFTPGQRITVNSFLLDQGNVTIAASIEFGGGGNSTNRPADIHVVRSDITTNISSTADLTTFQAGSFGAVNCTVEGNYRNADGVLRYSMWRNEYEGNVAGLPTAISSGANATVNDATSTTVGATVVGGGANTVGVKYVTASATWIIGG